MDDKAKLLTEAKNEVWILQHRPPNIYKLTWVSFSWGKISMSPKSM